MSTIAYAEMRQLAEGFEDIYPSAVCSGIVADKRHKRGYHKSRQDVTPRDYSVVRPDDRRGRGPDDGSAGIDMTMNRRDMILCTNRLAAVHHHHGDPRRKYLNAFNGWTGDGPAKRFDIYARRTSTATPDHKWHMHVEKRRRYIRSTVANAAILSALRGETIAEWLRSRGITPPRHLVAPRYPGRILQRTDNRDADPAVRTWQQRMRDRGWTSIGKADGYFGPRMDRTVKAWQKTVKLKRDGKIGPQTWPTPWTRPMAR